MLSRYQPVAQVAVPHLHVCSKLDGNATSPKTAKYPIGHSDYLHQHIPKAVGKPASQVMLLKNFHVCSHENSQFL